MNEVLLLMVLPYLPICVGVGIAMARFFSQVEKDRRACRRLWDEAEQRAWEAYMLKQLEVTKPEPPLPRTPPEPYRHFSRFSSRHPYR